VPGRFPTTQAGIVGPDDRVGRLGWWLRRIARGGRVVVPAEGWDQPMAVVDVRDLAGRLVAASEQSVPGALNADGQTGMVTYGGLLELCREVTGGDAEWVPVPEADLLAAGVEPWLHLRLWLPAETARTAWQVDRVRARELGLPSRPLARTVADTWAWLQGVVELPPPPHGLPRPGLPSELEAAVLAGRGGGEEPRPAVAGRGSLAPSRGSSRARER
jgi:nucleoside-diphosphate-sugar epimerase